MYFSKNCMLNHWQGVPKIYGELLKTDFLFNFNFIFFSSRKKGSKSAYEMASLVGAINHCGVAFLLNSHLLMTKVHTGEFASTRIAAHLHMIMYAIISQSRNAERRVWYLLPCTDANNEE